MLPLLLSAPVGAFTMIVPSFVLSSFTRSLAAHSFSNSSSVRGGSSTTLLGSFGISRMVLMMAFYDQTQKSPLSKSLWERASSRDLCRRSPNLPHTFACSTIGPARLNFRVRDGNGWDPRGMVTGKLKAFLTARYAIEKLGRRLAGFFSRSQIPSNGLFLPDELRQTGATQPNISQRNRLVYYRAC